MKNDDLDIFPRLVNEVRLRREQELKWAANMNKAAEQLAINEARAQRRQIWKFVTESVLCAATLTGLVVLWITACSVIG